MKSRRGNGDKVLATTVSGVVFVGAQAVAGLGLFETVLVYLSFTPHIL